MGTAQGCSERAKGISVIVGKAEAADGSEAPVYRALRTLLCSSCGAAIGEGTLFTRRALADGGLRVAARCRECAPFTLREGMRRDDVARRYSNRCSPRRPKENEGGESRDGRRGR